MLNILDFIPAGQHSTIKNYSSTYDITADAYAAIAALGSGEILLPAGKYNLDGTLILPVGVHLVGEGRRDRWGNNNVATIIQGGATLTGKRWTDITGSDAADDTPLIVAGGNNVWLRNMTLLTGPNGRSIGFLVPAQKQCGFDGLDAFDFTDACVYLDATWSDRNATMKALHPTVDPDAGPNEFKGDNFFLLGGGADGFGVKVQGTTRAGNAVGSAGLWQWGWGGASDVYLTKGRVGGQGANGGGVKHDGQLFDTSVLQGMTVRDTAFRNAGGTFFIDLDRSNRILLDGCYGENQGGATPRIAVTSRTKAGPDGFARINDKLNGRIYLDGVDTGYGSSDAPWEATRCMTTIRANQHRMFTPNIQATQSDPVRLTSFMANGDFELASDNGTTRAAYLKAFKTAIRPAVDGGMACGTGGFRWSALAAQTSTINTSDLREKDVDGLLSDDAALMRVAARLVGQGIAYRWKDAVEAKGDNARVHFGIGAQTVGEAFGAEGLDPADYAIWCKDFLFEDDEETPLLDADGAPAYRLGIRMDLLNALLVAYNNKRFDELEARLRDLE